MLFYIKVKKFLTFGGGILQVYKKIRAYIEKNGLKQLTIAQKAGISQNSFNAMMNGKRTMYTDDLRSICLALNVSPELFIEVHKKSEKCSKK